MYRTTFRLSEFVVGIVILVSIISCSTTRSWFSVEKGTDWFGANGMDKFLPMQENGYWKYAVTHYDSVGKRTGVNGEVEVDDIIEDKGFDGRTCCLVRTHGGDSLSDAVYSFTPAGDLQQFNDTSGRLESFLKKPCGLVGHWETVVPFSENHVGRTTIVRYDSLRFHNKSSGKILLGIRTHHWTYLGDSVIDVPVGKFKVQVRIDSVVEERNDGASHADTLTTVERRYYAVDVGVVRSFTTVTTVSAASWITTSFSRELVSYSVAPPLPDNP